jgi:hypothetical protein
MPLKLLVLCSAGDLLLLRMRFSPIDARPPSDDSRAASYLSSTWVLPGVLHGGGYDEVKR